MVVQLVAEAPANQVQVRLGRRSAMLFATILEDRFDVLADRLDLMLADLQLAIGQVDEVSIALLLYFSTQNIGNSSATRSRQPVATPATTPGNRSHCRPSPPAERKKQLAREFELAYS